MSLCLKALSEMYYIGDSFTISGKGSVLSVGRDGGNDLSIDHSSVSSRHAKIEVNKGEDICLVDCDSSNGTFVNGVRIDREQIKAGDLVKFAYAEFRVETASVSNGSDSSEVQDISDAEIQLAIVRKELADMRAEAGRKDRDLQKYQLNQTDAEARASEQKKELSAAGDHEIGLKSDLKNAQDRELALKDDLKSAQARELALNDDLNHAQDRELRLNDELKNAQDRETGLKRDLGEAGDREEGLKGDLKSARDIELGLEGKMATLGYELSQREESIRQWEQQIGEVSAVRDQWQEAHAVLEMTLENRDEALRQGEASVAEARGSFNSIVERLVSLTDLLLADWKQWIPAELKEEAGASSAEDTAFCRVETVRAHIRGQLDLIEPIWNEFGQNVQDELRARCDRLQEERDQLSEQISEQKKEQASLGKDLTRLRKEVDGEVRRAQGLSRKGTEIEIPERFESMVIARDEEQQIYRDLIDRVEFLDKLLDGYRRSRKLREVVVELEEFRERLSVVLDDHGVVAFEIEIGTMLTPKHRKEVRILAKKGWGTKEHGEKSFQPGEITKIVRQGYRAGEGEGAVILRKVEVLIREAEG
tara:strand:- start:629 stop:2404 length:1776 start_codon:yes stop_codon:yes gene_type:complete